MRPPRCWQGKAEGGFTIIELALVMVAIAIVASIVTLGVRQASDSFALRRAASITVSEIRRAQTGALSQRRDFVVEFNSTSPQGLIIYSLDDASVWQRVRSISAPVAGLDGEWPVRVDIVGSASTFPACGSGPGLPGSSSNKCLKFTSFGEPDPGAGGQHVTLRNSSGSELQVVVAPATGQVSIQR